MEFVSIEGPVPKDHLLRKIYTVVDKSASFYAWPA